MRPRRYPELSISDAREIVLGSRSGKLGSPSKMPGSSFGLSAYHCLRGNELANDVHTPCAHCYARQNYYATKDEVRVAHERRMANLNDPQWVPATVTLIEATAEADDPNDGGETFFRWHDSGDIQSLAHLASIIRVCTETPWVKHWLPTHEPFILLEYVQRIAKTGIAPIPPNLCIRISADFNDQPPAHIPGLEAFPTSTTHHGRGNRFVVQIPEHPNKSVECRSYTRTAQAHANHVGVCGSCRMCWKRNVRNISFPIHGEKTRLYQTHLPLFGT